MKFGRQRPSKSRATHSDAGRMTYTLWFACKHFIRRVKRIKLGMRKTGGVLLPQEIVHYIVDYISEDRPTLFACTRLSRAWCIAARIHLHRTFTISGLSEFKNIDDLERMDMIDLVHTVVVTRKVNQEDFLSPERLTFLNAFTHLQELDLRCLDVGQLVFELHERCSILKSTVRTLSLQYPTGTIKRIVSFIRLFHNLENLAVDGISKADTLDPPFPDLERSPPLTGRLKLSAISDQEFIRDLLQEGVKFRTVDLRYCREAQQIIDGCAETMERLIWHSSDFLENRNLKFPQCDSLRHVEVDFNSLVQAFPDRPFYEFVSSIPSPELETCLISGYDSDLDKLKQTFEVITKPKNNPNSWEEEGEEQPERDVKVIFGLNVEEAKAEEHPSIEEALDQAVGRGEFDFLSSPPELQVHLRVWN